MSGLNPSSRGQNMPMSAMRKLIPFANKAKTERGLELVRLNLGQPDIETPEPYWDAVENFRSTKGNLVAYAPSQGRPELVEALVKYYGDCGINFTKDQIIGTIGGCEAILIAFMAICDPGDEIVVFEPYYSNYSGLAAMAGVTLVPVPTFVKDGYHLPAREEIEKAITNKTRGIMYASPGNPTGTVYSKEELQLLIDVCKAKNIFLMADEVYREFCYDSEDYSPSLFHFEGVDEFAIMFDSFSKRYSACGARVGTVASRNKDVHAAMLKVATVRLSGPVLEQVGIAACINDGVADYLKRVNKSYKERRDLLVRRLNEIPGVYCPTPAGAFYAMASFEGIDAEDFCKWLLSDFEYNGATVLVSPGSGFYTTPNCGTTELRLAYVINIDQLNKALDILSRGIVEYRKVRGSKL
uniref:Aminotransferase class I/classII large domain-containing protein n=1 Tax=Vannella robusta TaxID=1487602 RepID=A0A7S4HMP5_9EUKA